MDFPFSSQLEISICITGDGLELRKRSTPQAYIARSIKLKLETG